MISNKVVIAGAGTMGSSLAQVYAKAGYDTVVYDISEKALEKSGHIIGVNENTMVDEGILSAGEAEKIKSLISFTADKSCFTDCGLVVESVVEDMDIKKDFWREVSGIVKDEAILSTNTSGLSISEMAKAVRLPGRFIGQHWLNPPHILPLCEIVVGEETREDVAAEMRKIVEGLGKSPVVVKDINGFLINRLQFAMLREAFYIVEMGAASVEDIDTVLKAGLGIRYAALGPFGTADFGGLDTFDHINSYLNASLGDSKEGSAMLRKMVEEGRLGVKSGRGFYDYSGDKADKAIAQRDKLFIELAKILYFKK